MAKKEFTYKGKTLTQLKEMGMDELAGILPAKQRRKIKRGFTDAEKKVIEYLRKDKKNVETHCRDLIILPEMVGKVVRVHKGNNFETISIREEMIGHCLGEFALTRKRVAHSAPGIGATRSSASLSVR